MSFLTVENAFSRLCTALDTPRSLAAHLLLKNGEFEQFLSLEIKPLDYLQHDLTKFRNDYLVTEYLSKYEAHDAGIDTEQVALDGFTANEKQCAEANKRIRRLLNGDETLQHWWPYIHRAQLLIRQAIGDRPSYELMAHYCKWGSGSTYSVRGYEVRVDNKVRENHISITQRAVRYFRYAMAEDLSYLRARRIPAEGPCSLTKTEFIIVRGGKGMTVPKNAKTDRFICNEPSGNIFLQLGVGKLIRLALKRVGVDLDDQSVNQSLAQLAIKLGLATVDLKAASDTICEALVWLLMPEAWARLLDDLRSPYIEVGGKWRELSKFSAMGNGFTFELESLIFWALTTALRDVDKKVGRVSVYGDDIICPEVCVPKLTELFAVCGFSLNAKKSHYADGLRESCGKHYFWGNDVSPVYQREALNDQEGKLDASAYRRFRNRLLYHAIDRVDVVVNGTAYADKAFRGVLKKFGDPMGPLVPIVRSGQRSLDHGDVVCLRKVKKVTWHGWSYSCKALSFVPHSEKGHTGALYSVYLRSRARNLDDLKAYHINPVLPSCRPFVDPRTHDLSPRRGRYLSRISPLRTYATYSLRSNDNRPLPFDSTVSLRDDEGIWKIGRQFYEEPLMLAWV